MDWPTASVIIVGMACWLADRLCPDLRAKPQPERTEAIGFWPDGAPADDDGH